MRIGKKFSLLMVLLLCFSLMVPMVVMADYDDYVEYAGYVGDHADYVGYVDYYDYADYVDHFVCEGSRATMEWILHSPVYFLNGEAFFASAVPFIEFNSVSGLPMVPIRYVAEALGATVNWNRAAGTVVVDTEEATWLISIDSPLPNDMGTPFVHDGRVFVPLAYVSEVLGASVNWDWATGTILIY